MHVYPRELNVCYEVKGQKTMANRRYSIQPDVISRGRRLRSQLDALCSDVAEVQRQHTIPMQEKELSRKEKGACEDRVKIGTRENRKMSKWQRNMCNSGNRPCR